MPLHPLTPIPPFVLNRLYSGFEKSKDPPDPQAQLDLISYNLILW